MPTVGRNVLPVGDLNNHPHNPTLEIIAKRDGTPFQSKLTHLKWKLLNNRRKPKSKPPQLP